jgi:hypothetical protein
MSTIGIFVSWKSAITKNPTRIASVMEIYCTFFQCKVYLSLFHSSLPLRYGIQVPKMMYITMVQNPKIS